MDPNAGLFGTDERSEEDKTYDQLYGKNPRRVSALNDLWYNEMMANVLEADVPVEAKFQMVFKMTANSILDMMWDAIPVEESLEASYYFDNYTGMSLTNKKYSVDLFKELQKALIAVKADEFESDEDYQNALMELEEAWWSISQPLLEKRNPNEAIIESLSKYGLNE